MNQPFVFPPKVEHNCQLAIPKNANDERSVEQSKIKIEITKFLNNSFWVYSFVLLCSAARRPTMVCTQHCCGHGCCFSTVHTVANESCTDRTARERERERDSVRRCIDGRGE